MKTQKELRAMLVDIYNCAAEANEKTPENIFAGYLEDAKKEGIKEVLAKYKEVFDNNLELLEIDELEKNDSFSSYLSI